MKIPDSELELMKELWVKSPIQLNDLYEKLPEREPGTIRTLLKRLITRGAVQQVNETRPYQYEPLITCEQYRNQALNDLSGQLFNSDPEALLCSFAQQLKLTDKQLAELRSIIQKGGSES